MHDIEPMLRPSQMCYSGLLHYILQLSREKSSDACAANTQPASVGRVCRAAACTRGPGPFALLHKAQHLIVDIKTVHQCCKLMRTRHWIDGKWPHCPQTLMCDSSRPSPLCPPGCSRCWVRLRVGAAYLLRQSPTCAHCQRCPLTSLT